MILVPPLSAPLKLLPEGQSKLCRSYDAAARMAGLLRLFV